MDKKIIIYGASGHAKVVIDVLEKQCKKIECIIDDDKSKWGKIFFGYKVLGGYDSLSEMKRENFDFFVAIGNNKIRKELSSKFKGISVIKLLHPSAIIGKNVKIAKGTVLMANSVVNSDTKIGKYCIINTSATIDHDSIIEDYVHVSPGAHLGGGVHIHGLSWIGIGASLLNGISIGKNCIIGAGSVVIGDVEPNSVVVGNPAVFIKRRKK